jgi:hypothetical protein
VWVEEPLVEYATVLPARERRADDAQRRALGIGAEHAEKSGGDADLHAVGDHRLLGLAAALRVDDVEREPVLLEDAGVLTEIGDKGLADAARAHRDLEGIVGGCRCRAQESETGRQDVRKMHALPPITLVVEQDLSAPSLPAQAGNPVHTRCQ